MTIAFVLFVIFFNISLGSILPSCLQSARTGVAPVKKIGVAVAKKVYHGTIISSPSFKPAPIYIEYKAQVPELVNKA